MEILKFGLQVWPVPVVAVHAARASTASGASQRSWRVRVIKIELAIKSCCVALSTTAESGSGCVGWSWQVVPFAMDERRKPFAAAAERKPGGAESTAMPGSGLCAHAASSEVRFDWNEASEPIETANAFVEVDLCISDMARAHTRAVRSANVCSNSKGRSQIQRRFALQPR